MVHGCTGACAAADCNSTAHLTSARHAHLIPAMLAPLCAPHPQIGIKPTIPLTADQLTDIPLSAGGFCRFASTDAAPALF